MVGNIDLNVLDSRLNTIRAAIVTGAFNGVRRSDIARMAIGLEQMHARMSRQLASTQAFMVAVIAAVSALASVARSLSGAWGVAVPLILVGVSLLLGLGLVLMASEKETLARMKDTHADLMRLAATLPVDEIPTGVRVDLEAFAGHDLAEVASYRPSEKAEKTP